MARPNEIFEDEENVDKARALIYAGDYDKIKELFESVLLVVKYNIRTAFVTQPGYRFNVSDLNAIETRVGAWMAGCESLLYGFRNIPDFDPYMDFAMKMTQIPYEVLMRDKKSKDPAIKARAKRHRQIAKPGVLGCIYRMGAVTLQEYAEGMGVVMTLEQAEEVVKIFREAYKEIVHMWFEIEKAIADVLAEGAVRVKRQIGPNGCIKFDKFVFTCTGSDGETYPRTILRIQLPSGRYLHYMDASIQETKMPWKDKNGNDVYKPTLVYATQDQKTKQWTQVTSHGGKVFENIDQGIARDVLAEKLLMFEEADLPVVLHVHDEGGSETENSDLAPGLATMNWIMAQPIDWAPGLPLGSDGFEGTYYHK
jgi:DNA polymerase